MHNHVEIYAEIIEYITIIPSGIIYQPAKRPGQ